MSPLRRVGKAPGARAASLLLGAVAAAFAVTHWQQVREREAVDSIAPVCRVDVSRPLVALSIDDGPSPVYTPRLLEILERFGARATFFVAGAVAEAHPELVRRELELGMEVGNHTWSHRDLTQLGEDARRSELERTQRLLERLSGGPGALAPIPLFRAPYGKIDSNGLRLAHELGLTPAHWTIAVERQLGGLGLTPVEASAAIAGAVRPGDVILAHDGGGDAPRDRTGTLQTLSLLLPELSARGYRVVGVGELLRAGPAVRAGDGRWPWQRGRRCSG